MVSLHELYRKRIENGVASASKTILRTLPVEISDVQENSYEEIKCFESLLFDLHGVVAVSRVAAFHLNSDLAAFGSAWVGMYANEVIPLVIERCLVRKDIPPH